MSPYEFSVISVEIIGNAYEQFLGKTITIGKNHSAKIELKPEVRKAGGVYYTPEYIVDYIVENTVGEAIKGKKPEEIANIKILDPACGSGSFLLGAYKYLLNYHIEYYNKIKDRAKFKGSKEDVIKENGDLTIWIKKQILRNNIFGVDIDSNAVEVTKLSLLMKCLEGESPASIQNNQDLFNERALPSLEDNIKCGNSLIGNDFYESHLDLDDDTLYKINCFDWNSKFRDIMKAGGFDVVIGNPPYVQIQGMEKELKEGYKEANYKNYISTGDIYQLFFEKGLDVLKAGGIVGMITSNKWMRAGYGAVTRDYFYRNANVWSSFVNIEEEGFGLEADTISLVEGQKVKLNVFIADAQNFKNFVWQSSNENIASVDENGAISAVAEGSAIITIKNSGSIQYAVQCVVNVTPKTLSIEIEEDEIEMLYGDERQITAYVTPENATNVFSWISENENVATVDQTGLITAVGVGIAIIKVVSTDGTNLSDSCKIKVSPILVSSITISKDDVLLKKGESFSLEVAVTPDNANDKSVIWKSLDENIVTVDSGIITGVGIGQTKVVVIANDGSELSDTCLITVVPPLVSSLSINKSELTLHKGDTDVLDVIILPEDAGDKTVIWKSLNENKNLGLCVLGLQIFQ